MSISWRPTTLAELDIVLAAEATSEAARFILPWSRAQHAAALADADVLHALLTTPEAPAPIGFLIVAGRTSPHRAVEFRRVVITAPGRGYGRATLAAVAHWAFGELGAHRLWLDVFEENARARHLYRTAGFVEEGVLREAIAGSAGTYRSLVVMSQLRREWEAQPAGGTLAPEASTR